MDEKDPYRERYPFTILVDRVEQRLEMGAEQYGDQAYVTKDVLAELEEEVLDCIAYMYLFYLKIQRLRAIAIGAGVM